MPAVRRPDHHLATPTTARTAHSEHRGLEGTAGLDVSTLKARKTRDPAKTRARILKVRHRRVRDQGLQRRANRADRAARTVQHPHAVPLVTVGRGCQRKPNAATPVGVPTYTRPLTITGAMNLLPAPNWSTPEGAWLLL